MSGKKFQNDKESHTMRASLKIREKNNVPYSDPYGVNRTSLTRDASVSNNPRFISSPLVNTRKYNQLKKPQNSSKNC